VLLGMTPLRKDGLSVRDYTLLLHKDGYVDVVQGVKIIGGITITISLNLALSPGGIGTGQIIGSEVKQTQTPLTGMTFVHIPGGSFQMGSNHGNKDEKPVHTVRIEPFYMMTTEVTQAMWQELMGSNPSHFWGYDSPVDQVSWEDAQEFMQKLNKRDPGKNYRLPSEAELEYACRCGTSNEYYTGDNESDLVRAGWYSGNSDSRTHPVGQKLPNAWGLYDMHGNVWEWCEDWYHKSYEGVPTDGQAWISPEGSFRVLRGGSWYDDHWYCRSSYRGKGGTGVRYYFVGVRVVRNP
jgi:formylglycine-generating enzyme required for sulfatase activity